MSLGSVGPCPLEYLQPLGPQYLRHGSRRGAPRCAGVQRLPHGCPWDEGTCSQVARGGHVEPLQWARARGCPWTCAWAAEGGHLAVLQWARANGCLWNKWTCMLAAQRCHQPLAFATGVRRGDPGRLAETRTSTRMRTSTRTPDRWQQRGSTPSERAGRPRVPGNRAPTSTAPVECSKRCTFGKGRRRPRPSLSCWPLSVVLHVR